MDKSRWTSKVFRKYFLIMKVRLELFGASKDLSDKDFLEFNIEKKISIKDLKKKIINYVDEKFKGNENYKHKCNILFNLDIQPIV